jgi:nucleotide-binding universal stress UspA family protein
MLRFKKILFPTDFSPCANHALKYSLLLAEKYQAKLTLFHAIIMFMDDPNNPDYRFPDLSETYNQIEKVCDRCFQQVMDESQKVDIDKVVVRGISPADEILRYAEENDISLIVMGTCGRSALGRFFFGSTAEKVVRHSHCPVLTVLEEPTEYIKTGKYDKILLPTDYSDTSKKAIPWAVSLAENHDAELILLHSIEENIPPQYYAGGVASIFELDRELKKRATKALDLFMEEVKGKKIKIKKVVVEGKSDEEIVNYAKKNNVDLIVLASHGHSGIERVLLGSTTERVVRKAPCPVLTVK